VAKASRRALIVTQYFWPETGAPQVRYAAITRTLVGLGVNVDVLTGVPNYPTGRIQPGYDVWRPHVELHDAVRIHRLPLFAYGGTNKWLRLLNQGSFAATAFGGVLMDLDPDVVLVESPPLPLVLPAAAIARRHGVPLVMYAADLWPAVPLAMGALSPGFIGDRMEDLESLCYRLSWKITVTSESHYKTIAAHPNGGKEKLLLLPNGADPETFHPLDASETTEQRARLGDRLASRALFVYAGTVGHVSALDTVLDAAEILKGDERIGFVLLGDGPERERLESDARARGLDSVRFLGSVPPAEVARYLSLARASISSQRAMAVYDHARPAKVLPSLACARAVIYAGRGEMAAILERERCGVVVPPEDPRALAGAVRKLTDSPEEARALGERGRAFALRDFDFPTLVRGWWSRIEAGLPPRTA
jgi:glycosyltransferase involved in cell wall biosynthesis